MKFLIIGLGSIGKRHIRNLLYLKVNPNNIWGFDPRQDRKNEVINYGVKNFVIDLKNIKEKFFDGVYICSPTSLHIKQAIIVGKKIKNIFIEKPLDSNLNHINQLKKIIYRFHLIPYSKIK